MRDLSQSDWLTVWEDGYGQPAIRKTTALLSAAFPEATAEAVAGYTVGQRNGMLLTVRERLFGSAFESVASCPRCGERLEMNFRASDIRAASEAPSGETLTVTASGVSVAFRLPTVADLAAVERYGSAEMVARKLLERCVVSARWAEEAGSAGAIDLNALPDDVFEAVAEAMERADPQAVIRLTLHCPACEHGWEALFDILDLLWRELDAWARRVLREVHHLASAYGWSERDILKMRPWRRRLYLDMIWK